MDDIQLTDPDPDWPNQYQLEKQQLEHLLVNEDISAIEHFGSTAIPDLVAKPIIDILIIVPYLEIAKQRLPSILDHLDYKYWAENPKTDRMFFVKGMPPYGKRRTHHVHVAQAGGDFSERLKFRDYLRINAEKRQAYADLKKQLALQHATDREAYTDAKSAFVASIREEIANQTD